MRANLQKQLAAHERYRQMQADTVALKQRNQERREAIEQEKIQERKVRESRRIRTSRDRRNSRGSLSLRIRIIIRIKKEHPETVSGRWAE